MNLKKIFLSVLFVLILLTALFYFFLLYQIRYAHKVMTNLYLGEYNLKGLTKEEVRQFLEEQILQIEKEGIRFYTSGKEITLYPIVIALADPDLTRRIIHFNLDQTIEEIFLLPQKKNFLFALREKERKIYLAVDFSRDEISKILKESFSSLEQPAEDASLKYEAGDWKITSEKEGFGFDYEKAIEDLKDNLFDLSLEPIRVETISLKPQIYEKDVETSLSEIKKIIDLAPINLGYSEKKWIITQEILKGWINLEKENGKISFDLNQEKIANFLEKIAKEIDRAVKEARFKMENERVVEFQISQEGRKLKIEENTEKVKKYIFLKFKDIELEVETVKPSVLIENVNELGIKELVGRGESDFKGSPRNRIHNIKIGAKTLNGILIKPGEEFSLLEAIGEVNESKGYLSELVIKADRTIPELGGGLCQIGTTTFRVALAAGLPITQRTPHAFRVIYYEPAGVDATIYNPWPDFRFINDYSSWLLLQTKIEGTKLIFELYGTADGRQVEVSAPRIFNVVPPGPTRYIETEELKPGEKKKVEKPVPGAETEFTRVITDAQGKKKEEVWRSRYRPWPEVWLVGKKSEAQSETTNPSESTN